jgi:SPP1 gp7 family putative phage head morphogenesis protein
MRRARLRRRAPKLPTGAMLTYRSELRRALARQQARIWAEIESTYVPPPARKDAAADGSGRDAPLELPAEVLDRVGGRVAKKSRTEAERAGYIRERRAENIREGKRLPGITRAQQGADRAMLDAWRKRNLGLIKTLEGTQRAQLGEVLDLATEEGWPIERLRKSVQERFSVTKSHADLIARDQTLKLNAQLSQHRQTSAGIREYIWSTSSDERVREEHAELDGTRQSWDDPPVVSESGDRAHPGEFFQCRCVAVAVVPWLEDDDEETT